MVAGTSLRGYARPMARLSQPVAMPMTNRALEPSWTIPSPGETLAGKYVIDGLCGRGGLAVVLSAMHSGLGQRVAVKMLLPEWAGDRDVVQRFVREGRAATRIKSEHVVRVFDVGTLESGAPYLVLEYLDGHDLAEVLAMWGPLPVSTAIDWILQAVEAIAEAHAYGIVHRDLKPANLFLTQRADGSACVKVLDFGLSKLTDPGMCGSSAKLTRPTDVMGSPHYMAPEQLRAPCEADARADLWALGAVLHELLTTQPPFRGETMPEICATVLTQPPPRLSSLRENVAPELERAVLRCLQKDPNARFATAAELARALSPFGSEVARRSCARIERVLETGGRASQLTPLPARAADSLDGPSLWPNEANVRRHAASSPRMILGSLLILGGLGAGAFLWMYSSVHGDEQRAPPTAVNATPPTHSGAPSIATPSRTAIAAPNTTATLPATAAPNATATAPATAVSTATVRPAPPPRGRGPTRAPRTPRPGRNAVAAATATAVVSQAPFEPRPSTPLASPNNESPSDDVFDGRK
jgi:serine/threonine-protein kinase